MITNIASTLLGMGMQKGQKVTGESHLRERRPGVWEVRIYLGRGPDGKVRQKSETVRGGKRKAEDHLREMLRKRKEGQLRVSKGTVAHLMDRYLAHLEGIGSSPSTLRSYRSYIIHNIEPEFGAMAMEDVTSEQLDAFYGKLRAGKMAQSTIRQHHAILSGALKQARKWKWVAENVAENATPPKVEKHDPVPPKIDEVRALVLLAEERNPTLATLLLVAATTGMRRGELCALRWTALDLDAGRMVISESIVEVGPGEWRPKDTKTHKSGRIALDPGTVAALVAHRKRLEKEARSGRVKLAVDGFVFSQVIDGSVPYRPGKVTGFFARLRSDAGCPNMKLHHLRHFMATRALASGADVRTVAGRLRHSPTMTLNVYGAFLEERDRALADHMGSLMAAPPAEDGAALGAG